MTIHPRWMGNLIDRNLPIADQPINKILIPGTHDSGTYGMDTRARTQSLTIKEQLEYGVRFLDCRILLNNSEDTFYFHHTLQSPNKFGSRNDTPATNQQNVLYDIRTFLVDNPKEILILKFQNITDFHTDQDYLDFLQLIKNYLEFSNAGPNRSSCKLVTPNQGTAAEIGKESLRSLNNKGMRVFLFLDVKNVPTDPVKAKQIWDFMFQYSPVLQKGNYGLWDPYWADDSSLSVKDVNHADMENFWKWHDANRQTWLAAGTNAGFYVLQSHMQVLHPAGNGSEAIYYNIAEQVADGNYYMNQDAQTGDFESNNTRNIQHYINDVKQNPNAVYNIIMFDYIQSGDVCSAIVDYYNHTIPPVPQPIQFGSVIGLKLNALNRYIGQGETSQGYYYPILREDPAQMFFRHAANVKDSRIVRDGDLVLICSPDSNTMVNQLSAYKTEQLYYYDGNSAHEQWIINNGKPGTEICTGDYVTFENKYYNQFLTLDGKYLTTTTDTPATRWIIADVFSGGQTVSAMTGELTIAADK